MKSLALDRSSNFELLRIICAVGVIMHHVAVRALAQPMPGYNRIVFAFLYVFFICDVDIFVMICGYFMAGAKKISLRKPVELLIQLQFLRIFMFLYQLLQGQTELNFEGLVLTLIPSDYFVMIYVGLFMLIPYINRAIDELSEDKFRVFLAVVFLTFSVWNYGVQVIEKIIDIGMPTSSTVSHSGAHGGRSIVNFALCYVVGVGIRKNYIRFKHPVFVLLACAGCNIVLYAIGSGLAGDYMSPFTIVQSAAAIMLVAKLKFHSKLVNFIARASLTVYIVHVPMLVARIDYMNLAVQPLVNMLAKFALIVFASYALGLVMHYIYHFTTVALRRALGKKLDKIVISV